ncbi:hypothetical protein AB2M62_12275 [Sphingomonas sp. MMS12-HWE2-04]|uniref:hypothetical protein n=1 Tax=Sphingomonas sp. MMS12-HWE2-04 TaxID=3234199 RepID=UPI00384DE3A0
MLSTFSALSLLLAIPAESKPRQSVDCILEGLDSANSAQIAAEGAIFIETGNFSAGVGPLLTTAPACMALYHWSAAQTQLAGRYTIAKLALPSAEAELRRKGINPEKLKAIYLSLPTANRSRIFTRSDAAIMVSKSQAAGLVRSDSELSILGRYVGLLNMIDAIPTMIG